MCRAIELARQTSLVHRAGGPLGCVIVLDGEIIAEGANTVLADCDPTCHAEMNAIRDACKFLGSHDLHDCVIYTTGEPCPMCYAACWWARIGKIYYASTIQDAKKYGDFDDEPILDSMCCPIASRKIAGEQILHQDMLSLWKEFSDMPNPIHY